MAVTVIILQSTMVSLNGTKLIVGSFLKGYKLWIGKFTYIVCGHVLMVVMEFLAGGSCLDLVFPSLFVVDCS